LALHTNDEVSREHLRLRMAQRSDHDKELIPDGCLAHPEVDHVA
jgi:hypothetical protein